MSKDDIMKMATGMSKKPNMLYEKELINRYLYSKKEVGMMKKAYLDRIKKANDLAVEMTNKGRMSDAFGRPGSLRKPLAGKYQEIDKLRKEADIIETELLRNQWVEMIGRVPNIKDLGKLKMQGLPKGAARDLNPNRGPSKIAPFLLPEIEEAGY
jgi:hypothetical protein